MRLDGVILRWCFVSFGATLPARCFTVVTYLQHDRKNVFLTAKKEITGVLADNLLNKFKSTEEYKDVASDVFFDSK